MRTSTRNYFKDLEQRDLTQEYSAVNALQRTPWRVNKDVLQVMRQVWDSGESWANLPAKDNLVPPPYPFDREGKELTEAEQNQFKDWKRTVATIHRANAETKGKRIQVERSIQFAEMYCKYDAFYYVWQLDFRGRKYPVETFMTPQGADWGKGLLEFARPMTINSYEDARWLAIHGANLYGEDKISLDDRVKWAYDRELQIAMTAANPTDYTWWTEADKPFQFLAWVFEFNRWLAEGKGTQTYIPCAADGSCNGLQHLSAILRDAEGGSAVNLTPSPLPRDIYRDVAEAALVTIRRDAEAGHEMAKKCIEFGVDRKLTKRSVMIVPYSGTKHSSRAYIQDAIVEKIEKGTPNVFGKEIFKASMYLSDHIWDAINTIIVSAQEVMNYIKDIGAAYAEANLPFQWVTPTNFLVMQDYPKLKKQRIKTYLDGSVVKLELRTPEEEKMDRRRACSASSPNFIHSLDAAAMTKTINACHAQGIQDFSMVHDSYATHSVRMPEMVSLLKSEFVKMYEENDFLQQLNDQVVRDLGRDSAPDIPEKGTLEISEVNGSDYFFA
jgi:DNA-directed RNA polymerase